MTTPARPLPTPPRQLDLFTWLIKLRTRDLLTVREVAEITRLSEQSIRLLLDEGQLAGFSYKLGESKEQQKRISVESLCRYLLESSTLSDQDRADLLLTWLDKLDLRTIDFLTPLMARRRERLAAHAS